MKTVQKWGGAAALYQAAAYLAAIVFFLFIANYPSITDPREKMAFLLKNQLGMYGMYTAAYVVFGLALVVLTLALYDRLKTGSPAIMQTAAALGLIWAGTLIASGMVFTMGMKTVLDLYPKDAGQALTIWLTIESVSSGLSSGNGEILGGLWTLLVSLAALRSARLPKALNCLGLAVGFVGLLSALPLLNDLTAVFGLTQLVWFTWLGITLLRKSFSASDSSSILSM
ncbi:MAG: DUF4386 family protein [Chloroflexi bacterium]|nr:DUF4386 family protein [Chloroflexota bacterium]